MLDRAVIWDIDGTIISSSLERRFLAYLRERGIVSERELAGRFSQLLWRWRLPRWHLVKACYLRSMKVNDAELVMQKFFESEVKPAIRGSAAKVIVGTGRLGYKQLLLSGTLQPLADLLGTHLGVSEIIAAVPVVSGDNYTGELTAPVARGKLKVAIADRWLEQQGLSWRQALAVADHWGDRYLLEKAASAVVVQPTGKLRRLAQRRGWDVISDPEAEAAFLILADLITNEAGTC